MDKNTQYLLRYVSMDTYQKILKENNNYIIGLLIDNYVDVNLNIKYLINYGITNIDTVIPNILNELVISNKEFTKKIEKYEEKLAKEEVIMLIENM